MTRLEQDLSGAVLARCAMAITAAALLYSNAMLYWYQASGGPKPLYLIAAVVAAAIALLLVNPHRPTQVFRSPLLLWAYAYLLVSTAWAIWRPEYSGQTDQALIDRYRCMALLFAMAVVFEDRRARWCGRVAILTFAIVSALVNSAESAGLIVFDDSLRRYAGRAAGLFGNPNQAGIAIACGLAVGILAAPRVLRVPLLLVGAAGVAATFSRGSLLCVAVLILVLLWRKEIGAWLAAVGALAVAGSLAYVGGHLERFLETGGSLNRDTIARLTMTADDSGRGSLALKVWSRFVDSPWLGHGLATEREGRISHNMYLSLASEHGLVGIVAYPALLVAIAIRNHPGLALTAVLLVGGIFSHNLLEAEPLLVCMALAASESRVDSGTGAEDTEERATPSLPATRRASA